MDTKIAQKRVDDLSAAMVAKGMRAPEVTLMLRSHKETCVHLSWSDKSQTYGTAYDSFDGETITEAFDKATAFIAARPDPEQAKLNEFLGALGKVIDLGKKHGIEADYLNPLVASMKKLSSNILTHGDQHAA